MNKKGSLSLSMNAIVVVVLAFAMLGLGLVLTNTVFQNVNNNIPDIPDFDGEATANDPLTINDEVSVKRGSSQNMKISFYNNAPNAVNDGTLVITQCINDAGTPIDREELPSIISPSQKVEASSGASYNLIFSINGKNEFLGGQTYICKLGVVDATNVEGGLIKETLTGDDVFEVKQFFLQVTS